MSDEQTVILPLPNPKLSPNARVHWAVKAKHKKAYRRIGYTLALYSELNKHRYSSYRLEFTFKDKRRRDRDNAVASMKSGLDGISDAIGQDDSEWDFDGVRFMEPDKNNPHVKVIFK